MPFVFPLMMKLLSDTIYLKAVKVVGTSLLRENLSTLSKKIAKSSSTSVNLCIKSYHVCDIYLIDVIL